MTALSGKLDSIAGAAHLLTIPVRTENLIHVDEVTESPKLVE
jgi:hypothetical protein